MLHGCPTVLEAVGDNGSYLLSAVVHSLNLF